MVSIFAALAFPPAYAVPNPNVLVFSKTAAFRHDSIPDAIAAIQKMGKEKGFTVDATEDAAAFTPENLAKYDVVVFASTTGDVLTNPQQQALQQFVNRGKGWVGIHAAADTEYDWPWYGELVGAYFKSHPAGLQPTKVKIENRGHASTNSLPENWTRSDEWYDWRVNPRGKVQVLASIDDSTFRTEVLDHPVTWCKYQGRGRAWYTAMGHSKETYVEPAFLDQLYGGIMWAAQAGKPDRATGAIWKSLETWSLVGTTITNKGGDALLTSIQKFKDGLVHFDYKFSAEGSTILSVQGNYGLVVSEKGRNGIFSVKDRPLTEAYAGVGNWNSIDAVFRAPRFVNGQLTEKAKFIEVRLNGVLIHKNVEVSVSSGEQASGPLTIRRFGGVSPEFRNVWVQPLNLP